MVIILCLIIKSGVIQQGRCSLKRKPSILGWKVAFKTAFFLFRRLEQTQVLRELHTHGFPQQHHCPQHRQLQWSKVFCSQYHLGRELNPNAQAEFLPCSTILWLMPCFSEKQAVVPTQLSPGRAPHTLECGIPTITCSTPQNSKILVSSLKIRHWIKSHPCPEMRSIK